MRCTLLVLCLCAAWLASTSYATWIPTLELPSEQWQSIYSGYNILSTYKTCAVHQAGGSSHFVSLYKKTPATIVVVGTGSGNIDVKFQDSIYTFDNKVTLSRDSPCIVIPPYQPVDWVMVDIAGETKVCVFEDTISAGETASQSSSCDCASVLQDAAKCSTVKVPHTIRKPEHEFFLTAEITPDDDDVTITTILTVDRLLRLSQMSEFWGGPISAAVYLHNPKEIGDVYSWWLSNTTMRKHVDIHIVYDDKIVAFELPDRAFPVNILRNVAIRFARTANVFYIEGDFIPSKDLYPSLADVKKRLATGEKSVFIVAAFSSYKVDFDMSIFPNDKKALQKLIATPDNLIKSLSYYNSHAAFRYDHWYGANSVEKMGYSAGFEPYYIGPKTYPLFDEIFIGCGADKVSHPTELNAHGYEFYVLPEGFIVHLDSTGMGSAWCQAWGGNKRSSLKWDSFQRKVSHLQSGTAFKEPWWDLAPVPHPGNGKTVRGLIAPNENDGGKECPPCEKCRTCPVCKDKPCPPCVAAAADQNSITVHDCKQFIDGYETEISLVKQTLEQAEKLVEAFKVKTAAHSKAIAQYEVEIKKLKDINSFTLNLALGGSVVVLVSVGVVVCVWPRNNKKVWVLPSWKSNHHNL